MIDVDHVGWLDHPRPICGPLDAIVRPTIVAPCTSDVQVSHGWAGQRSDCVLGHEAVGIVEEVGADVRRFHRGDLVAVPCVTPDWLAPGVQHPRSLAHDEGEQASFKFAGQKDGVMAEVFHVNQADANLAHVPKAVAPESALMAVDMMSTGFRAVEVAEIGFGETVVVIGIGPVGLMAVAGSVLRGAGRVIAVGTRDRARQAAIDYGATEVLSYKDGSIGDQVAGLLKGQSPDKVIVAGGDQTTLAEAVRMVRPGGIVSNVNFYDTTSVLSLPLASWGMGMADKDIRGSYCPGGGQRLAAMLALIEYGRMDPTKLITHRLSGWDGVPQAFDLMTRKPPDLIKPIVYLDRTTVQCLTREGCAGFVRLIHPGP